ncbi:MAG TPA: sulfite exporter TauE/SafE family protein, partial [Epsilonproteobacteria bacterium]|nr:sulfite exporter TauE/SafE family protein [Campylobacterota bacterium]
MELLLVLLGIFVGVVSGFFGIGGGTLSIPILLYMGFDIKAAIGISVMQMLFGSLAAFLIHRKQQTYCISDVKYFGFGGLAGAVVGGYLVKILHPSWLEWLFLGLVVFALVKLFMSNPVPDKEEIVNRPLYVGIGSGVGIFSGMLGVGGSILMTPILVSFLGFSLKKASAIGLFFVIFSSVSSFV